MLVYGIIKGLDNLEKYCLRRWGEKPRWCETIAHCKEATIELHYWKSPTDDGFKDYYLLYMEHPDGKLSSTRQICDEAREAVETGRARLLNERRERDGERPRGVR